MSTFSFTTGKACGFQHKQEGFPLIKKYFTLILLLCTVALAAASLAGCTKTGEQQSSPEAGPQAETEMVYTPVLDMQYRDVLSQFDIVGKFHNGIAFAANLIIPENEEELFDKIEHSALAVECGYVTLEGSYTPLYTVPYEFDLYSPEKTPFIQGRKVPELFTARAPEGEALLMNAKEEDLKRDDLFCVPYTDHQERIDEIFSVGDNGWVPYYENEKWGYCDLNGNVTLAPAYDFVQPFDRGKALVCTYDGMYHWSVIDETGAQQAVFEPSENFAVHHRGSDFLIMLGKNEYESRCLYRMDGTVADDSNERLYKSYQDNGAGILVSQHFVYDAAGSFMYQNDSIAAAYGVQNGCTVYTDDTSFGILGRDGEVRCKARFSEILKLTPEGFYGREKGSRNICLYDFDGNLLQENPPCVSIVPRAAGGFDVQDGAGNVLAEFPSDEQYHTKSSEEFFTEDGFAYLHLDEKTFITLHITFEERPAQADENPSVEHASSSQPSASQPEVMQTADMLSDSRWNNLNNWTFEMPDYDSMSLSERHAFVTGNGLNWYVTPDYNLIVCDSALNTVFQVSSDTILDLTENHSKLLDVQLRYIGEGLWSLVLTQVNGDPCAVILFDRSGNLIYEKKYDHLSSDRLTSIVSEGYIVAFDTIVSADGKTVNPLETGKKIPLFSGHSRGYFKGGIAPTPYGYADTQGKLVLSGEKIEQELKEYAGADMWLENLDSFEDDGTALIFARKSQYDEYMYLYRIDRTGAVVEECGKETEEEYRTREERLEEQLRKEYSSIAPRGAFQVESTANGTCVITPSGTEVSGVQGTCLTGKIVQPNNLYSFVEVKIPETRQTYWTLLDAQGNFHPEFAWNEVFSVEDGSVNAYVSGENEEVITMQHIVFQEK